jgi:hypothetical protein
MRIKKYTKRQKEEHKLKRKKEIVGWGNRKFP